MSNSYCIFLYSHSDYLDIWNLTFGQIYKYINLDEVSIIFCIDKLNNYKIDDRIKVIYYDDNQIYSDRVLNNIINLQYDYILFLHEDWVITNTLSNEYILTLIEFMNKKNILHVRSYKNFGLSTMNSNIFYKEIGICNIPNDANTFIALQPGLWENNILKELYSIKSNSPNDLEKANLIQIFRNKLNNKFFYETDSLISQHSTMFPHIHTIAYGQWAICNDNYNIFESLLIKYNIDKHLRGYFNRKTGENVKPQI